MIKSYTSDKIARERRFFMPTRQSSSKTTLRRLIFSALFAAIIFVATSYLKVPLPVMGYVHLGDGIIFLAATILPLPYAIGAAAIGAAFADLMAGYTQYILATFILKALTAACFSALKGRSVTTRNLLALIPAVILNVGGYYLFEALIYNSLVSPIANTPFNAVQSVCGVVIFILLGVMIDKTRALSDIFEGIRPKKKSKNQSTKE